jgi:hypothetical protein
MSTKKIIGKVDIAGQQAPKRTAVANVVQKPMQRGDPNSRPYSPSAQPVADGLQSDQPRGGN